MRFISPLGDFARVLFARQKFVFSQLEKKQGRGSVRHENENDDVQTVSSPPPPLRFCRSVLVLSLSLFYTRACNSIR